MTNLKIIKCKNKVEASKKAFKILLRDVDKETLLFLSGGTSPKELYQLIAQNKTLRPGAIAMIDERYGLPMHDNSNEKMIADTGLTAFLDKEGIPFYKVLNGKDVESTTKSYGQTVSNLLKQYPKNVAIVGIGADGHTAGIKPSLEYDHADLVVSYDDTTGFFGKRITLTFEALQKIGEFIVLIFGENKKGALQKMFMERDKKIIPAVFYTDCSAKVTLLTDIRMRS